MSSPDSEGRYEPKNIKCDAETYDALTDAKPPDETWDEFLRRLAQLERATRIEE